MTEQEIDALIERAGLSGVMMMYGSAIEIDCHEKHPAGGWFDSYSALAALLAFYGDERARAERERAAQVCEELTAARAAEMGLVGIDHLTGFRCAAAIRALPVTP